MAGSAAGSSADGGETLDLSQLGGVESQADLAGLLIESVDGTSPLNPRWHLVMGGNSS